MVFHGSWNQESGLEQKSKSQASFSRVTNEAEQQQSGGDLERCSNAPGTLPVPI